jgi:hypothetical protein
MRLRVIPAVILLVCTALPVLSQASFKPDAFSSVPEASVIQSRTFNRESLYGYIDGGAELYLEYGFDTLFVTELSCRGSDLQAEIYRMKDDEAAFGIFSVSRFRCNGGPKLTEHMCRSAYQLQFCKGPFYVSIVNDEGTKADQECANELASVILSRISEPSFSPGRFFEQEPDEETMRSAVLVRGPLGVFNGIPDLEEIMGQASGYTALIIRKDGRNVASVFFADETNAAAFTAERNTCLSSDTTVNRSGSVISVASPQHVYITFE